MPSTAWADIPAERPVETLAWLPHADTSQPVPDH